MQPEVKAYYSEEVLKEACAHYNIPFEDAKLIRAFSNLIFDCGDKFLRLSHSSLRAFAEVEVELDWLDFVHKQGLPVVQLIHSKNQKKQVQINNGNTHFTAVCFERIEGKRVSPTQWKPSLFKNLGLINAQLNLAALEYPEKDYLHYLHWDEIPEFKNSPYLPKDDRQLEKVHDQLVAKFRAMPKNPDEYRIIHYDMHHGNYMVNAQNDITVLDFEMSCKSWFINDIASTIYYTAQYPLAEGQTAKAFEALFMKHFLAGYQSIRSLNPTLIKEIPSFILYRGLLVLGFLHKVTDFENLQESQRKYLQVVNEGIDRKIAALDV